jgi:hypothetical protein
MHTCTYKKRFFSAVAREGVRHPPTDGRLEPRTMDRVLDLDEVFVEELKLVLDLAEGFLEELKLVLVE